MIRFNAGRKTLPAALALIIGMAAAAMAQYSVTVGNTPGGGNTVIGNGSLGSLVTGDGKLSNVGFDNITFNLGSVAIGSGTNTVTINTSNNTLLNNGTINAALEFNAVVLNGTSQTITNNGAINGGSGNISATASGGIGIHAYSISTLSGISITNHSTVTGGAGADSNGSTIGGSGGHAIVINSLANIDGITINNTGSVTGGAGGSGGGFSGFQGLDGGKGIFLYANGAMTNVSVTNSGNITGGKGGDAAYNAYTGYGDDAIYADARGDITGFAIANTGTISGGASGNGTNAHAYAGQGGDGVHVSSSYSIVNFSVSNSGLISGGKGGDTEDNGSSGQGGSALYLSPDEQLAGFSLVNSGNILGGDGGSAPFNFSNGGTGGMAIDIESNNGTTDFQLINSGAIRGGAGGVGGSYASSGAGGDAIYFYENNQINGMVLTNHGSITGGNGVAGDYGSSSGYGGDGLYITGRQGINALTINNSGFILGGNGGSAATSGATAGGEGGDGLVITSSSESTLAIVNTVTVYSDITDVTINNTGNILGGNGGIGGYEYDSGNSGYGLSVRATRGSVDGLSIHNAGTISAGNGADSLQQYGDTGNGRPGINIYGMQFVMNVGITNSASGKILGGDGGSSSNFSGGGYGADAILVDSNSRDINGFTLTNAGMIKGGRGGLGDDANNYSGGSGGSGVYIYSGNGVFNIVIDNSGAILGGDSGNGRFQDYSPGIFIEAGDDVMKNVSVNNSGVIAGGRGGFSQTRGGGDGADGVSIFGDGGDVTNVQIVNSNYIAGGNAGGSGDPLSYSGEGGAGVYIYSNDGLYNSSVTNSGRIKGGNAGSGGYGADGGNGVGVFAYGDLVNFTLTNTGVITGGNGNGVGEGPFSGGAAVSIGTHNAVDAEITTFQADEHVTKNIVVNNHGTLRGGAGLNGANPGPGVDLMTNNATINNWGTIAAGAGANRVAINIQGDHNTVNLYGHSVTDGMVVASGATNTNHLNIKLTGVSPAVALDLSSQLAAQGVNPGEESSGSLTIRGITISWDPIVVNLQTSSYQLQGLTPNQQAIGANLDSFIVNPTGDMLNLLNAIDVSGAVPLSLEALSPQPYQLFGDIAISNATFTTLSIDQRLNNLRDGSESIDTMGIGGNTDKTTAGFSKDGKNVVVPAKEALERRWGFFATGDGLFSKVDAHGGDLSDAKFTSAGLMLGVDGKINDNWVVGLLFNYSYTSADLDNHGSKANVETFGGGVYAGYHNAGWYANGLATYGHNSYDSKRNIAFGAFNRMANGSTDGNQYTGNIDGGYDFKVTDKITAGPLVGFQYVHLDVDSFNESGAGAANLAVGSQSVDSLRSRLGVRAEYRTQIAKEVAFATELRAAWQHEFLDDSRSISGQFIGSGLGAFNVQTTKPQRDSALVGIGANFTVRDRMTIFVDYDVQAGQSSYLEQSIKGGIKISF